ncbi:MAG: hypothetical protein JRN08_09630, partial [Nitrososphaerota archaeon]|nr:hypothetical protein [Nitrososphaerota archaeon]
SSTGVTVTGTVINEGTASAYYAQAEASIRGAVSPGDYIGEIDANTPLSFSVSVPVTPGASAQSNVPVTISFNYTDSFGQAHAFTTTMRTSLESASQLLSSSSGAETTSGTGYGILSLRLFALLAFFAAVVAVGLLLLRRRAHSGNKEPEDDKVI